MLLLTLCNFGQKRDSVNAKQIDEIRKQIQTVKSENDKLRKNLTETSDKVAEQNNQIKELQEQTNKTNESINQKTASINDKIETSDKMATNQFNDLTNSLSRNAIVGIIIGLLIAILSISLFLWLRRNQRSEKTDLETAVNATRKTLEEESIRLDNKLAEILSLQINNVNTQAQEKETDHSLVLKVANEMNRMRMNIINMNPDTRGLKQLNRALNNMIDSLQSKGYEIVDLLGKPYDIDMNVLASMEPDEKLEIGEERIRRIIKPQINFEGKTIQAGEVVVGYSE